MPNKQSAAKELRKAKIRASRNRKTESLLRNIFKNTLELVKEGKSDEALKLAISYQQAVDKAVKKKITSKNKASRRKNKLMKTLKDGK